MSSSKTKLSLCNILIAGKTGAGKSLLLNAVFGKKLAKTGVGKPVTSNIVRYDISTPDHIAIFDTPGLRTYTETTLEIQEHITSLIKHFQRSNEKEPIHVVWYCINASGKRIEDSEITWIKELARQNIKIIIILTQFFGGSTDEEFLDYIKSLELPVYKIIPVLAEPFEISTTLVIPSQGLDKLVETTASLLPVTARSIFLQAQIVTPQLIEHY